MSGRSGRQRARQQDAGRKHATLIDQLTSQLGWSETQLKDAETYVRGASEVINRHRAQILKAGEGCDLLRQELYECLLCEGVFEEELLRLRGAFKTAEQTHDRQLAELFTSRANQDLTAFVTRQMARLPDTPPPGASQKELREFARRAAGLPQPDRALLREFDGLTPQVQLSRGILIDGFQRMSVALGHLHAARSRLLRYHMSRRPTLAQQERARREKLPFLPAARPGEEDDMALVWRDAMHLVSRVISHPDREELGLPTLTKQLVLGPFDFERETRPQLPWAPGENELPPGHEDGRAHEEVLRTRSSAAGLGQLFTATDGLTSPDNHWEVLGILERRLGDVQQEYRQQKRAGTAAQEETKAQAQSWRDWLSSLIWNRGRADGEPPREGLDDPALETMELLWKCQEAPTEELLDRLLAALEMHGTELRRRLEECERGLNPLREGTAELRQVLATVQEQVGRDTAETTLVGDKTGKDGVARKITDLLNSDNATVTAGVVLAMVGLTKGANVFVRVATTGGYSVLVLYLVYRQLVDTIGVVTQTLAGGTQPVRPVMDFVEASGRRLLNMPLKAAQNGISENARRERSNKRKDLLDAHNAAEKQKKAAREAVKQAANGLQHNNLVNLLADTNAGNLAALWRPENEAAPGNQTNLTALERLFEQTPNQARAGGAQANTNVAGNPPVPADPNGTAATAGTAAAATGALQKQPEQTSFREKTSFIWPMMAMVAWSFSTVTQTLMSAAYVYVGYQIVVALDQIYHDPVGFLTGYLPSVLEGFENFTGYVGLSQQGVRSQVLARTTLSLDLISNGGVTITFGESVSQFLRHYPLISYAFGGGAQTHDGDSIWLLSSGFSTLVTRPRLFFGLGVAALMINGLPLVGVPFGSLLQVAMANPNIPLWTQTAINLSLPGLLRGLQYLIIATARTALTEDDLKGLVDEQRESGNPLGRAVSTLFWATGLDNLAVFANGLYLPRAQDFFGPLATASYRHIGTVWRGGALQTNRPLKLVIFSGLVACGLLLTATAETANVLNFMTLIGAFAYPDLEGLPNLSGGMINTFMVQSSHASLLVTLFLGQSLLRYVTTAPLIGKGLSAIKLIVSGLDLGTWVGKLITFSKTSYEELTEVLDSKHEANLAVLMGAADPAFGQLYTTAEIAKFEQQLYPTGAAQVTRLLYFNEEHLYRRRCVVSLWMRPLVGGGAERASNITQSAAAFLQQGGDTLDPRTFYRQNGDLHTSLTKSGDLTEADRVNRCQILSLVVQAFGSAMCGLNPSRLEGITFSQAILTFERFNFANLVFTKIEEPGDRTPAAAASPASLSQANVAGQTSIGSTTTLSPKQRAIVSVLTISNLTPDTEEPVGGGSSTTATRIRPGTLSQMGWSQFISADLDPEYTYRVQLAFLTNSAETLAVTQRTQALSKAQQQRQTKLTPKRDPTREPVEQVSF